MEGHLEKLLHSKNLHPPGFIKIIV